MVFQSKFSKIKPQNFNFSNPQNFKTMQKSSRYVNKSYTTHFYADEATIPTLSQLCKGDDFALLADCWHRLSQRDRPCKDAALVPDFPIRNESGARFDEDDLRRALLHIDCISPKAPVYVRCGRNGYPSVYYRVKGVWNRHSAYLHRLLACQYFINVPHHWEVHHRDLNPLNATRSNLLPLPGYLHRYIHAHQGLAAALAADDDLGLIFDFYSCWGDYLVPDWDGDDPSATLFPVSDAGNIYELLA